jgi:hypothetical protein
MTALSSHDPVRTLAWPHGRAELQRLGAMLAPVVFGAPGRPDFAPLQVAPWADEPGAEHLPGILRRLRGEWPCVPFGRTDRPAGLSEAWAARAPGDGFGHGYASNHAWQWHETGDPLALTLMIEPPGPLRRLTRSVRAVPDAPALEITLAIEVREPCTLPVALHPTLRLDLGGVELELPSHGAGVTYPVPAEAGVSRLAADRRFDRLAAAPCADGTPLDLGRYPLDIDTEELLQLRDLAGPVTLHYRDAGWALQLDWDRRLLPDLMLWVSHRGRSYAPWNGRHRALGIEPVNGAFDLGRVATAPVGHPLADRHGLALRPDAPCVLRYRFAAMPEGRA